MSREVDKKSQKLFPFLRMTKMELYQFTGNPTQLDLRRIFVILFLNTSFLSNSTEEGLRVASARIKPLCALKGRELSN